VVSKILSAITYGSVLICIFRSAFQGSGGRQGGSLTPRTLNSLSAIAGHEGDEEDWEKEIHGLRNEEEVSVHI
jgi:hypothetical protein